VAAQLGRALQLSPAEWDAVVELVKSLPQLARLSDGDRQVVLAAIGADGARTLAGLAGDERRSAGQGLRVVAHALAAPLAADAGRIGKVWIARVLRIGICVAGLLAVVLAVALREEEEEVVTGPNLALGRPVTMSSRYAEGKVGHDPSALVDGNPTNMGFHTDRGGPQHVTIDLGAERRIRRVVVYNRTDCCAEKAVPLRIEVSEDGKKYREVAQRKENFDIWKAKLSPTDARYVKLTCLGGDYFHLAEVEVY
jgi:hypothetical protein